ncbi:MAG: RNA polymerase sigma factor [Flavobacteriia bacterium]|nr:RNA polymerase sigma factor [Flavobacteriia bacterium]
MEEGLLVNECLKGNAKAQKALFDRFAPKMLAICFRYMKNQDDSEDVLQIGMVKVFAKLSDFKKEGPLEGWIRRIMVNSCLDQLRRNKKFITDMRMDYVSYRLEVKEEVLSQLAAEDLMQLIQKMPTGYRVVFNLFAIEGYSHQEIAETLQISESTSKTQYLRARAYLRQRIESKDESRIV